MKKYLQNRVAESRLTLPVVMVYALGVWMLTGLLVPSYPPSAQVLAAGAWVPLLCFLASTYLMVELNNSNALIRVYSRTMSGTFAVLMCCACFLFGNVGGAVAQMFIIGSYLMVFRAYQDKEAVGAVFYAFLALSLGTMAVMHVLWLVPLFWLLMLFQLNCLSWRTFLASVIGLLTPYWFLACWLVYQQDFGYFADHFLPLVQLPRPLDYTAVTVSQAAVFALTVVAGLTGMIHYLRNSYQDKIRIRELFSCFIAMSIVSALLTVVFPQHFDLLFRLLVVNVSPLVAHFLALTRTRFTNVAFCVFTAAALIVTMLSLWMPSSVF